MKKSMIAVLIVTSGLLCADLGEIRSILANRVDEGKKAVGIVVGTIDAKGRQSIGYGTRFERGQSGTGR
jgi:hypothetical protein